MRRTGTASLPLHDGRCPPWLYRRMVELAGVLAEAIVEEYGPDEFLRRLSDPGWFQAFGCVLGFDWHSSGLTTVSLAALKEGLAGREDRVGVHVAGGKGRHSRGTPDEIRQTGDRVGLADAERLVEWSRLVAKVDNTALQDGYQLYHHVFVYTHRGSWAVVQQGMPRDAGLRARRYHWLSEQVTDPVSDPHEGIVGDAAIGTVLDLTAGESAAARQKTLAVTREDAARDLERALACLPAAPELVLPAAHAVPRAAHWNRVLHHLYERPPEDFAGLLLTPGVGPSTLRALVMAAEVIHGVRASRTDPVRYSFAHGGKDGHPFPVSREDFDHSITVLRRGLERARAGQREAMAALSRLARWEAEVAPAD